MMSDEIENDEIEVKRGRRSGRNGQVKIRADHAERPTKVVDESMTIGVWEKS